MYLALRPVYQLVKETPPEWRFVRFEELGIVRDMAEAKALFGGSPVLQEVRG